MISKLLLSAALLIAAIPASAADNSTSAFKVSGSVALAADYRFRGVSQSNNGFAVQGGLTLNHKTGIYGGFWSSNLAGWGTFGGPNLELDLFAGYKLPLKDGTLDLGLTWYMYPGGADKTDFAEAYIKINGTAGPVGLTAGIAYAPKQEALGRWYLSGSSAQTGIPDEPGAKDDNLYLWGDAAFGIKETPVTLKAHIGYSDGNPGLGPNGTSVAPTGAYWDWLLGADVLVGPVTLGVAYVDTDIDARSAEYLRIQPNFSSTKDGSSIAGSKLLFSISAAF